MVTCGSFYLFHFGFLSTEWPMVADLFSAIGYGYLTFMGLSFLFKNKINGDS